MDYSIRSLRRTEGTKKKNREEMNAQKAEDTNTQVINLVRDVYQKKGGKPIDVTALLNFVNKRDITRLTRDQLLDTLRYYAKL